MSSLKDVLSCTLDALDNARDLYQMILTQLHGSANDYFFEKYSRDRLYRFNDEVQQAREHFKDVYDMNESLKCTINSLYFLDKVVIQLIQIVEKYEITNEEREYLFDNVNAFHANMKEATEHFNNEKSS